MRTVKIKISEKDYCDMVHHFAAGKFGRVLVAVVAVVDDESAQAIEEEAAIFIRRSFDHNGNDCTMTVPK